jgi:hypothetical protein
VRGFCLLLALCSLLFAQPSTPTPEEQRFVEDVKPVIPWIQAGEFAKAEARLREVLPSPKSEPKPANGTKPVINISIYGLTWGLLVAGYLGVGDYTSAERVLTGRVSAIESEFGSNHLGVTPFLDTLGTTHLRQHKPDKALVAFRRSLEIRKSHKGFDTVVLSGGTYAGMAEALLMQNQAAEAVALLRSLGPQDAKGLFSGTILNPLVVALREAGETNAAAEIERSLDADTLIREGIHAQSRDFLRARLLAARQKPAEAEAIYKRWIAHWEAWGESVKNDRREREWDRVLMEPLSEYALFLGERGRKIEAEARRARVKAIAAKYQALPASR